MKLMDFLFENEEEDNRKRSYTPQEYFITTKETPIEKVEDALEDLNNYGQYKSYQQNVDVNVQQAKEFLAGPPGAPPVKKAKAKVLWNNSNDIWRNAKLQDIKNRIPGIDTTKLTDLSYDELPQEIKDSFYNLRYTKNDLDDLITSLTSKASILSWDKQDNLLIFPREANKNIPGDDTLEKILRTIMGSAGIKDFIIDKQDAEIEKAPKSKEKEKETPSISSYNILKSPDGSILSIEDAEDLKDDLESKISDLNPEKSDLKIKVIPSKQDPNNAILQISGFKSNKERGTIQQKVQDYMNRLFERKLKKSLQVRAGIIK
jgi:hypothetical protein